MFLSNLTKPLKIYLGDLTYNTVTLSTNAFPLNIGYIASYCKSLFGDKVDISLFKYISDLEDAIGNSPPDVLGLSNYAWNRKISLEMSRILFEENPNAITVFGGPNFPQDFKSQEKFLKTFPEIDVYVPGEGEIGFSNVISFLLENLSKSNLKKLIHSSSIQGCAILKENNKIEYSIPTNRLKDLDEIPSPYLNGFMDEFFDGQLYPMLQTNRGCPFLCSYCVDGQTSVNQVNKFSLNRVLDEINYIAKKVPSSTHSMHISDLNFGMIPRDLEICKALAETRRNYNYPTRVLATTGKNSKERIIDAIKLLDGAMRIYMSVQSMDTEVLTNIRRANISLEQMLALSPAIKEAGLRTTSEVILGLPGETYASHLQTLRDLISAKLDAIEVYTCMLIDGSELNTPEERNKWDFKSKFRILPRDFVKLKSGKKILEIEEVVVGSNALSFDEYVELRLIAFCLYVTNIGIVYDAPIKLLRENNIHPFELFYRIVKDLSTAPSQIQKIFEGFKNATIDELWDSPEEIESHYQNDDQFQKLVNGEAGFNVIQSFHALVTSEYMQDWTNYALDITHKILNENGLFNSEIEQQFSDVENFCKGLSHNVMNIDRMETNPQFSFVYDIQKWLDNSDDRLLKTFMFPDTTNIKFYLTDEQFKIVQDEINLHGSDSVGKAQVLKRIPIHLLWRKSLIN